MEKFKVHKIFAQSASSLALIIPADFARLLGLADGSYVAIRVDNGKLVIEKIVGPNVEVS